MPASSRYARHPAAAAADRVVGRPRAARALRLQRAHATLCPDNELRFVDADDTTVGAVCLNQKRADAPARQGRRRARRRAHLKRGHDRRPPTASSPCPSPASPCFWTATMNSSCVSVILLDLLQSHESPPLVRRERARRREWPGRGSPFSTSQRRRRQMKGMERPKRGWERLGRTPQNSTI